MTVRRGRFRRESGPKQSASLLVFLPREAAAEGARLRAGPGSVRQDLAQKQPGPLALWIGEKFRWWRALDDLAAVHAHHVVGDRSGEPHLMRYAHHRHALLGQLNHDVEHLLDHL